MPRPIANPPNPWHSTHVEWIDAPPARLHVYHEAARTILSRNDSPDLPFRYSLNPYRGCFHACAYCYARPSHMYWDFGAGTDFERRIVVKTNAAERLVETFERRGWRGELVVMSGNTDPYQPLEASYGLTRACLEVFLRYRNPLSIITKGALIRRDIDLLAELARVASLRVHVSLPFLDAAMARAIEPSAPSPRVRLEAIRALADAGVETGVSVSPIIPGLNDDQVPAILEAAHAAGARRAFRTLLRLPGPVEGIFEETIRRELPLRAERVLNALRAERGGHLTTGAFGRRMEGTTPRWAMTARLFDTTCTRLGMEPREVPTDADAAEARSTFQRPSAQGSLF